MTTNLVIVAFILAMAYWMSLQGFFSAFLHLIIVLIAGSIALALWEPLVFNFGMKMQPQYAWGLWLLGPFVLLLIFLRLVMDRVVRKNVNFQNLISTLLGGACGVAAGFLTAGIAIIGIGFLPLPQSLAGIDPYVVSGGGQVERIGTTLWLPVDTVASNVFTGLSRGAFATDTPLSTHQPDLARQASLYRMGKGYDPHASIIAAPGGVEVTGFYSLPAPVKELDPAVALQFGAAFNNPRNRLIVVDTRWQDHQDGTFDIDNAVRIPPTQISLVTQPSTPGGAVGEPTFHNPIGFSHQDRDTRFYQGFDAADVVAFGNRQSETFGWVFLIPADHRPQFLFVRHLRLPLPEASGDAEALAQAIGQPKPTESQTASANGASQTQAGEVGGREGIRAGNVAVGIENRHDLPRQVSKNYVQGLDTVGTGVRQGKAVAARAPSSISRNTVIDSIHIANHQAGVRLQIQQDRAQSLLGQSRVAAASLQGVWITDDRGDRYEPIGYVWLQGGDRQEISVDRTRPIRSARELPVAQMGSGDELYLYFAVPKGTRIVSYNIGSTTQQTVDLVAN